MARKRPPAIEIVAIEFQIQKLHTKIKGKRHKFKIGMDRLKAMDSSNQKIGGTRKHLSDLDRDIKKNETKLADAIKRKRELELIAANETTGNVRKKLIAKTAASELNKELRKQDSLLRVIKNVEVTLGKAQTDSAPLYDLFISHASEDKEEFAKPLATELRSKGLKVWYDDFTLKLGDSLRRSIDHGLSNSRYGLVILSSHFFAKNWTEYELNGLVAREMEGKKVILPLWHKVTKNEVMKYSPSLADKVALNTSLFSIEEIANKLSDAIDAAQDAG